MLCLPSSYWLLGYMAGVALTMVATGVAIMGGAREDQGSIFFGGILLSICWPLTLPTLIGMIAYKLFHRAKP